MHRAAVRQLDRSNRCLVHIGLALCLTFSIAASALAQTGVEATARSAAQDPNEQYTDEQYLEEHSECGIDGPEQDLPPELIGREVEARAEDWNAVRAQLGELTTVDQVTAGALLYVTDTDGLYLRAPEIEQTVTIEVYGLVARTRVEQKFSNPTEAWLEGVYTFPLPEKAAVDELRMYVGTREIKGVIQEKEEAKKNYEAARASGRRASLVEQERPNLFTNSVANIGPHEEIVVSIEYQEDLRYDQGRIGLRFPMVVAPRYNPGNHAIQGVLGSGWGQNTDQVPDAQRITPPVLLTPTSFGYYGSSGSGVGFADLSNGEPVRNPVELSVFIDHTLVLDGISSPSHSILVTDTPHAYVVELDAGKVPANRDFVLEWWPDRRSAPQAALYTQDLGGETYAHLVVVPPQESSSHPRRSLRSQPREVVFIIDTSGSMGGTSIRQAKAALRLALDRLQAHDTFDIIEFDSVARALFSTPQPAGTAQIEQANRFVRSLDAGGGTNMLAALDLALVPTHGSQNERTRGLVRQVVFITDGSVGNEQQLFSTIEQRLDDRRLFTVGIGSAPNNHFMRRAAEFGRGTFTNVSDLAEVEERMARLFEKLESPALVDIEVHWEGFAASEVAAIEAWPQRLPDLYSGEPVVLNARLPLLERGRGELVLTGTRAGIPWQTRLPIERTEERSGIDRLWARAKIRSLMDEITRGAALDLVRPAVVDLGLRHHLVTQFTSLVAIDSEVARPPQENLLSGPIPVLLPEGWDATTTFGIGGPGRALPAGGTTSRVAIAAGLLLLLVGAITWRRSAG